MISGRTVEDIAAGRPAEGQEGESQDGRLAGVRPAGAGDAEADPPRGDAWVHEIKFDGYRLEAQVRGGKAKLLTRGGQDWTDRFGPVAEALAALPARTAILDGELVVEAASGASDFSALQADLAAGRSDRFRYYLFDLLYLDGRDLSSGRSSSARRRSPSSSRARRTRCGSASTSRRTARRC